MVNDDDYDLVSDSLLYQFVYLYKILIFFKYISISNKWSFLRYFWSLLNKPSWIFVDKFKSLMKHFEDVNVGGTKKWISLLQTRRGLVLQMEEE
jgi:hypothetical protein